MTLPGEGARGLAHSEMRPLKRRERRAPQRLWLVLLAVTIASYGTPAAEIPKVPVPSSPYIALVYRYADTLLEHGRDIYGAQKTGLFLSALDRATLQPLTNRPAAPDGVREADRAGGVALTGCNPQHDQNLLRLLYTLTELSTKAKYRDAADAELKWLAEHPASDGGFPVWDAVKDEPIRTGATNSPIFFRPWMLWDRCFQVAPEASRKSTLAFRDYGARGEDLPPRIGFRIRALAYAYAHTKDEQFLKEIDTELTFYEKRRNNDPWIASAPPIAFLSFAIDCDGGAHHVPSSLAARLRSLATAEDDFFCKVAHEVDGTFGFEIRPEFGQGGGAHTLLWRSRGRYTTAQAAMMCVSRYDNTGNARFRKLIMSAARAYTNSPPDTAVDIWPGTLGQAISLEIAAWRHSAQPQYFDYARKLADFAVEKFLDKSPLPRASLKSEHYEAITGADTLMLGLLELHLNVLHITAVRCPQNTIDR